MVKPLWEVIYKTLTFVNLPIIDHLHTLYNVIVRIARNLLETRKNIKFESHSFYHIICDWFSWGCGKNILIFLKTQKTKQKKRELALLKNSVFLSRPFWISFCLIPMKISHKLCDRMNRTQFWCFPWFAANSLLCVILHYIQCISVAIFLYLNFSTFTNNDGFHSENILFGKNCMYCYTILNRLVSLSKVCC